MSTIKVNRAQLGQSATATQNFTLTAEAADGTIKLARGNAGATSQDILTVDASGHVFVGGNDLNLFSNRSLSANGYQKLPSGLIIQWGGGLAAIGGSAINFPIAFPASCFLVVASGANNNDVGVTAYSQTLTDFVANAISGAGGPYSFSFIAIGY